jgi:integrase/recombinase XerD
MNTASQARYRSTDHALLISSLNQKLVEQYLTWKKSYTSAAFFAYKIWVVRFQEFVSKEPEFFGLADYVAFANSLQGRHEPKGIQFALNIVHNYLRFFAEQGRLRFPLYLARVPKAYTNSHQVITEEEYRKVVAHMNAARKVNLRDLAAFMLLHDTGMRIGELLSLDLQDIEEDRSAVIRTEKTVGQRRVYWNPDTEEILQRYIVERVNEGPSDLDALFVNSRGSRIGRLHRRSLERTMKSMLLECGIVQNLSPHSFRHAFIHRLAKLGVPDAIIAQLVGHSTPATIAHYTKLSRPEFKEFATRQLIASLESMVP